MTKELEFSVILPLCHDVSFLKKALTSLRQIKFPSACFEILVVGDDDDDESCKIVKDEAGNVKYDLKYINSKDPNRSRKLNVACEVARGCVLVFADDDCIFLPDWLKKLNVVMQRESNIGIVGGEDELQHYGPAFDMALDYVLNSFLGTGGLRRGTGIRTGRYYPKLWNMAIPRDVASSVALKTEDGLIQVFDESLVVHEDVDLANRIEKSGKRVIFAPEVRVKHFRDTNFLSFVLRNVNMARISRRLGVHRFSHVMLSIFMILTVGLTISSILFHPLRVLLMIYMGTYTALLFVSTVNGFKRTRRLKVILMIPLLTLSLHIARGLGYLFPRGGKKRMEVGL